jgi:cell filamentation protein
VSYAAEHDPLCYPGTSVLINNAGITRQEELDEFELSMFLTRAEETAPNGRLDYEHYRRLHHHLFQDVYDWAGQPRTIRIGKGGNWFCYPEYIEREMTRAFEVLVHANYYLGSGRQEFARGTAHVLAEINAIHPFREGNGRCQLAFLKLLADNADFPFDADQLDPRRAIAAMIASFGDDEVPLAALINDLID